MAQENEIKIIVEAEVKRALKNLKKVQKEGETTGQKMGKMTQKMKAGWLVAAGGIAASIIAMKKAFDFTKEFAMFQQATSAMKNQFGKDADDVIKKLGAVSGGAISNAKLIEGANRAMALNVTKDLGQMADLLEVARFRAQTMGITTTQAFDDIVTGIGRQSPLILDNLGIITKGWDAEAKAAGKAFDQQFILNKILRQGAADIKDAGGVALTSAEKMLRFGASIENIKLKIGESLMPVFNALEPILFKILSFFERLPKKIALVGTALTILIPIVITIGALFGPMALAIAAVSVAFGAAALSMVDFRKEGEKLVDINQKIIDKEKALERARTRGGRSAKAAVRSLEKQLIALKKEKIAIQALIDKKDAHEKKIKSNIAAREKELEQSKEQALIDEKKVKFEAKRAEGEEELEGKRREAAKASFNATVEVMDNLFARRINSLNAEKQAIQDKVDDGVLTEEQGAAKMASLDNKIKAEKRKQFIADKAAALIEIAISQAVGHARIWGKFGAFPPIAAGLSAALGVVGLAQTAIVASQPIPAFAMGTGSAPGGDALVGEAGPERVSLPEGAVVTSNHELLAKAGSTTNNNTENFDNRNITLNVQTNNFEDFIRKAQQKFGRGVFS